MFTRLSIKNWTSAISTQSAKVRDTLAMLVIMTHLCGTQGCILEAHNEGAPLSWATDHGWPLGSRQEWQYESESDSLHCFPLTQNTVPLSISSFRAPVSSVPSPTIHTHCQKPGSFVSWERSCWDVGLSGLKLGQPWANWDWWVTLELQGGRELPTHTHQETNLYCAKPPRAQDWSAEKAGDIMLMVGTPSCCLAPCLAAQVDVAVIQTAPQEQSWCGQPEDHPEREV